MMKLGKVTGRVAMTKRSEELDQAEILLVEMEGNSVAALDKAGAQPGDRVLVVMSHAAGRYSADTPSDAVVVGVVQE